MSTVARTTVSADTNSQIHLPNITGLYAGATLAAGDIVYIKGSDGKVYPCNATDTTAPSIPDGIVLRAANALEPITIWPKGTRLKYAASGVLTPGAVFFISATTAGATDTAATTGDAVGVLKAITDTDVRVIRDN